MLNGSKNRLILAARVQRRGTVRAPLAPLNFQIGKFTEKKSFHRNAASWSPNEVVPDVLTFTKMTAVDLHHIVYLLAVYRLRGFSPCRNGDSHRQHPSLRLRTCHG